VYCGTGAIFRPLPRPPLLGSSYSPTLSRRIADPATWNSVHIQPVPRHSSDPETTSSLNLVCRVPPDLGHFVEGRPKMSNTFNHSQVLTSSMCSNNTKSRSSASTAAFVLQGISCVYKFIVVPASLSWAWAPHCTVLLELSCISSPQRLERQPFDPALFG